jgi:hypothetical protein
MQEVLDAALARRLDDDLGATEIDVVKIGLSRHPHPRQAGQVIDLVNVVHRAVHQVAIKHRSPDMLDLRQRPRGWLQIKHPHLPTPRDQRRGEVLSDESTAACDQYTRHATGALKLNYSKSRCSTLRVVLDDDGEIAPKAQRDKQLRHDKHRAQQQVGRIVDQRRLPPFEHAVSNYLRCDANGNQEGRK